MKTYLNSFLFHPTLKAFASAIASAALGLALGLLVTFFAGDNPWHVFMVLFKSAFGSSYDLGMTLSYATPLVFTGLSVAIAFQAGLFNVGAEGQLAIGAFAAAALGVVFPNCPWPLAPILATLVAFTAGGIWGFIPGWLLAKRGSHEVISTIMLNFISAGLVSWLAIDVLPGSASQNVETPPVSDNFRLTHLSYFGEAPVNTSLIIAICVVFVLAFWRLKTRKGIELSWVGKNEIAAEVAGVNVSQSKMWAMFMAGGLAGLVALPEVLGAAGKFRLGFSPEYGFTGIAVALLARGNPLGVLPAAFLFGALHKGTADLDFETEKITRDISLILQSMVILTVSAEGLWQFLKRKK